MKIVFVSNAFSENTGYIVNCLPKALAKLGHEVHLIAPNVQVYFNSPDYEKTYGSFLGPPIVEVGKLEIDGFTVHRLPHKVFKNEQLFKEGLYRTLKEIRPDVVQIFHIESFIAWQVFWCKLRLGFQLFSANHSLRSVFTVADDWPKMSAWRKFNWWAKHKMAGRLLSSTFQKVYCQTPDAGEIAVDYYGAPQHKIVIEPLGVDTDLFRPKLEKKKQLKEQLGFSEDDQLCIYTGRFSEGKSPLILAQAIHHLSESHPHIKGFFIGNGPQEESIRQLKNCRISPFVPFNELPKIYQAGDLGVWPREESTSMLDAMASGLPLIISDTVTATERIEGNGASYVENDPIDLSKKIVALLENKEKYRQLSTFGVEKARKNYSWDAFAENRLKDYAAALKK